MKRSLSILFVLWYCCLAYAQNNAEVSPATSDTSAEAPFQKHFDGYACQEFYDRKAQLESFQRRGYADMLSRVCSHDPLSAIIDYVRMRFQIDYSLNHNPIYCRDRGGYVIVLSLDWMYPDDPWKHVERRY